VVILNVVIVFVINFWMTDLDFLLHIFAGEEDDDHEHLVRAVRQAVEFSGQ